MLFMEVCYRWTSNGSSKEVLEQCKYLIIIIIKKNDWIRI